MAKYRFWAIITIALTAWAGFFVWNTENKGTNKFKLGLDLSGGTHLIYKADVVGIEPSNVDEAMVSLRDTIERRVNLFGVSEPIVQVEKGGVFGNEQKEQRLIVELPGITNVEEAVRKIGETPTLEFKLLRSEVEDFIPTGLSGRQLEKAQIQFDPNFASKPIVALKFNGEGTDLFAKITRENKDRVLGIFLDNVLIEAPYIREEIKGGEAVITGNFTLDQARQVVRDLNYGALPMPISLVSTETIGATLGSVALNNGIRASIVGLSLVALFMIIWYRLPGFLATLALSVYMILMLLLFKIIPVTLTVAGIAGFIISIGMAIDANIIIFARLKDELKDGHHFGTALNNAFSHAWSAVRDGQLTTLLSAIVLFWFGTGSVEGFALVLGLGTIISVFSSMVVSKIFMKSIYASN